MINLDLLTPQVMHQFVSTDVRRPLALPTIHITIHACLAFSLEDIIRQHCKRYGFIQKHHIGHYILHYFFIPRCNFATIHYLSKSLDENQMHTWQF